MCGGLRGGEGAGRNDFLLLMLLVNFSSKGGGLDVLSQTLFSGALCDTLCWLLCPLILGAAGSSGRSSHVCVGKLWTEWQFPHVPGYHVGGAPLYVSDPFISIVVKCCRRLKQFCCEELIKIP